MQIRVSKPRRFRKVSLRLALFVLMPLCALTFLLVSRVSHANTQLRILQALEDQAILDPYESISANDVWWEAFWGGDPMLSIDYAHISGTPDQWAAIATLTNLKYLDLDEPPGDLTAKQMREFVNSHPNLEGIGVYGSLAQDAWLELSKVAGLKQLHSHEGCNVSDVSLSYFADGGLTELLLDQCPNLTDKACQSIAKMRTLQKLSLTGAAVTLSNTRVSDLGLQRLDGLSKLQVLLCDRTYVSPTAMNRLADTVTQDRAGTGIYLRWGGAARIDTASGTLSGYVPAYPRSLSNEWAVEHANPRMIFGLLPSEPMTRIRDVHDWSSSMTLESDHLLTLHSGALSFYELPGGRRSRQVHFLTLRSSDHPIRFVQGQLLTFHYNSCVAWDAKTCKQLWSVPVSQVKGNEWVIRENRLALLDLQGVQVLTVAGKKVERKRYSSGEASSTLHFPFFLGVGFGDAGNVIVAQVSVQGGPIEIRDLDAGEIVATIPVKTQNAVLSANAKFLATPASDQAAISIWNAMTGEKIADVVGEFDSSRMKFTPDGRYLIVAVPNNVIKPEYR